MHTRRITFRDGERSEAEFSVRAYTYTELADLLRSTGFAVVADYGDTDTDADFAADADRLCLVAEREDGR